MPRAREPPRAVDIGMRHGPARIGLEGERLGHPARAEIAGQRVVVARGGVGEAVEQAVRALEHGARADEAGTRQQRRAQARLRRPAGVHALGPGAFGEIFDDAAGHASRRCRARRRVGARSSFERGADAGRRRHGAEHGGRMEARLVHRLRRHEAEPAHHLDADRDAAAAPTARPDRAARRRRAPPARSRRRHAPGRPRRCRRNPRHARRCR